MATNTKESVKPVEISEETRARIEDDLRLYGNAYIQIDRATRKGARINPLNIVICDTFRAVNRE